MEFIADFHIHSKYSRATSRDMDVKHITEWAKLKGVTLMGSGDFTHHLWLEELKHNLEDLGNGLFKYQGIYFILTTEISSIYSKKGKTYRIHNIIFSPSFKTTDKINATLARFGNIASDGRPILGMDAAELARIVFDIDENCMIVPGHIWTPWFSLFGSMSGFDRIEDCFEKQTPKIFALETGLSSDPPVNWRLSALDKFTLVSNSDSHCVYPDTKIYTIDGKPIAIKDLNPSKVLSIDFAGDLRQVEGRVAKLHKIPALPVLCRITTRTKEIIATSEHRFFVLENEEIKEKAASGLERNDLVACLRRVSELKRFAESDIIWESVQEVKKIKSDCKYVYDLTIPNYENYVANGFITHNSPQKIGREANVFDCELNYKTIREVLKTKDKKRFLYTVEFFPQEGKYHFDGHRLCGVRLSPEQTKENKGKCPKCGRLVTVGVMNRVEQLADRPQGYVPQGTIPYKNLVPLNEIIAEAKGINKGSVAIERDYRSFIARFGTEFNILLKLPKEDLLKGWPSRVAEGILRVREGKVKIQAGFDGEYGIISIFGEEEKDKKNEQQLSLF